MTETSYLQNIEIYYITINLFRISVFYERPIVGDVTLQIARCLGFRFDFGEKENELRGQLVVTQSRYLILVLPQFEFGGYLVKCVFIQSSMNIVCFRVW